MADLARRQQHPQRDEAAVAADDRADERRAAALLEEYRATVERLAAAGVERYAPWRDQPRDEQGPDGPSGSVGPGSVGA